MRYLLIIGFFALGLFSCVDRDFDAPPAIEREDVTIPADQIITIAELIAMRDGEEFTPIQIDMYISATIVADDQSGNFFKSLVLQDETGGISLLLDDVELWNRYFVGNRLFVHLERIWLGEFAELPQIGFEPFLDDDNRFSMARIPAAEISDVALLGAFVGAPTPNTRSINELSSDDLNTLVILENVEFNSGSAGAPFADAVGLNAVNHTLEDCDGNNIIVRTSGFADFANTLTPGGNGTLTAIYSIFNNDKQLLIRDLDDVDMSGERCDGTSTGGGGGPSEVDPDKVVSIASILDLWVEDVETPIGTDEFIQGFVVSSDETGNFFKSIVINDGTNGIAILVDAFDTYIDYTIGAEVFVALEDLFISDFGGLPQLGYSPSAENIKRIPEGLVSSILIKSGNSTLVDPVQTDISSLSPDLVNTLIEIDDIQFIDSDTGGTYANNGTPGNGYNATLEDCDGNLMTLRTSDFADFADDRIPTANGTIRGVLQIFAGTYQLILNFPENVNLISERCDGTGGGGTGTGGGDEVFQTGFENQPDFESVNLEGWQNIATAGDRVWEKRSFSGNGFAEIKAFEDSNPNTDAWLISPEINTSERSRLTFISATAFYVHDGLEVLYSQDYDGSNAATATWNTIDVTLAGSNSDQFEWVNSETIDLTQFGSNINIAFHYTGTSSNNTSTYRIDDLSIN